MRREGMSFARVITTAITLEWINTFLPLIVPKFFGQAFFIFLMIQFIRSIPIDLDEAAEIDGAGKAGIFFRIILPLIKPALVTSGIFSFYWTWEDFFGPLLYLNAPNLYTVSLALKNFSTHPLRRTGPQSSPCPSCRSCRSLPFSLCSRNIWSKASAPLV